MFVADRSDRNTLTPDTALAKLTAACEQVSVDSTGAELLRMGSNAVFRLPDRVVARVARDGSERVRTGVEVARWLESEGFPAVRALPVEQPVLVGGTPVTFWVSVSEEDEYATVVEVAEIVRDLHKLSQPATLELPELDPFIRGAQHIESAPAVTDGDRAFLREWLSSLRERYDQASFELPTGVVHGDASIGNVVHDRDGRPVLIDLDGFAVGPREWDLVLTALYYERFGWHSTEEYEAFVRTYGYDVRSSPAYEMLCDLRELLMVTWLAQKSGESQRTAREVSKRVHALRAGGSRKDWSPY
ncbi:MAG: phosphotransferase [Streptosporangiales bacterium]|nr:phosphotransferase [Streptosporangiales bacterium]